MRRSLRLLAFVVPVLTAACIGDEDPIAPPVPIEDANFAASLGVDLSQSTETPSGLWYRVLTPGSGAQVVRNDSTFVDYTLWFIDGRQVETGKFGFQVGAEPRRVIPGLDEAVLAMRVGEARQLIVPPELAYGTLGFGPVPPNAILVFRVKVDSVHVPDPIG